jgi:glycosyltransferase involved in cell wall biosynthesis
MKLTVIIPCYNEENTINELVTKVINNNYSNKEIIIIDDCSKDNSKKIIAKFEDTNNIKAIYHDKNMGKGSCIKSAIKEASGEICIIQDADLEYDPKEHLKVITPILQNKADVVYGSRFRGGEVSRSVYFWNRFGNWALTTLCNILINTNLTDMETCFKAIKTDKLKKIEIKEKRFGFEPEITIKLSKLGCRFYEVGISYYGREYDEGKKITWVDGIVAIKCIFFYTFFN